VPPTTRTTASGAAQRRTDLERMAIAALLLAGGTKAERSS
jgi:hypothetical protein